jgi:hypothetical protein
VIGAFSASSSNSAPLDLGGFVPVPVVTKPDQESTWDLRSLGIKEAKTGERVDLTVVRIGAGAGLYTWTLVAPGPRSELALPSLEELAPAGALPRGSTSIEVTLARIDAQEKTAGGKPEPFNYGSLRYRQLDERGWNAYATDTVLTEH